MQDIYVINETVEVARMEKELLEQITVTHAIFSAIHDELLENVRDMNKQQLVVLFLQQVLEAQTLCQHLYGMDRETKDIQQTLFILSPHLKEADLRIALTDRLYLLNSLAHVNRDLLMEEIDDHLVNTLIIVNKYTHAAVKLVEQLDLRKYAC